MRKLYAVLFIMIFFTACTNKDAVREDAQAFIDAYTKTYKALSYTAEQSQWRSNTMIVEGDTTNAYATRKAMEALAGFTGSADIIEGAQKHLKKKKVLLPLQVAQLETILYIAANNPQTVPELVKERIKAETEQVETLYGFDFKMDGVPVSTSDIDEILKKESNLQKRLIAWEASKEVGKKLEDGLVDLQRLRNETVRALGYDDYFSYQVSDYGMTTAELMDLMVKLNREIRPLYRELHTFARYELAKRYGATEVPDMLPAHWLPNRWGQDWTPMITVEGFDLDGVLRNKSADWITHQGERFFVSLGFPELPGSFWEWSSLYPLPPDAGYKKNNHASAWHLDLEYDVRSLMSVIPNAEWYETVHHEYGHVYYYITYTNPDVPLLLRGGANRGFHEAIGSLVGLASMQKPFLEHLDLLPKGSETDENRVLLKEALNYIVFIPWSAGVMTEFEHDLYAGEIPKSELNEKWWALKAKYQGIAPPAPRGREYCDPASKTHINNDPGQYYDYALSYVLLFQFHDHIARNILNQDPHATNYYGSKEVGSFLHDLLYPGSSRDWRELLNETIGEELSAEAMVRYFEPLMAYLKKLNEGREHTLGDL